MTQTGKIPAQRNGNATGQVIACAGFFERLSIGLKVLTHPFQDLLGNLNSDYGKWNKKPPCSKMLLSLCTEMKNGRAPEIHKVRNDRAWSESFHFTKPLVGVWRDLEDNQCWKYAQSSPLQLLKDLKFDLCRADKNEIARAEYFGIVGRACFP